MAKKLILTEHQYRNLTNFINETRFESLIKKSAQSGDEIKIDFAKVSYRFKVLENNDGQIKMESLDSGNNSNFIFIMPCTSLRGDTLEIKKIPKNKSNTDTNKWKDERWKDVKKIDLIRGGKVINNQSNDKTAKVDAKDGFSVEAENNLWIILNELTDGKGITFHRKGKSELSFCCASREGSEFNLELITKEAGWDKYKSFILTVHGTPDASNNKSSNEDLYTLNKTIIKNTNDSFSLAIEYDDGNETIFGWINKILGITIIDKCKPSSPEKDVKQSTPINKASNHKPNDVEDIDKLKSDGKKAMDIILNDPNLKKAFYSQPSLWELFVSELKSKEATGKGIVPTLNIVGKYLDKKMTERLHAEFTEGKVVIVKPVNSITIPYIKNGKNNNFTFESLNGDVYETVVGKGKLGGNITLISRNKNQIVQYRIEIIKRLSNIPDSFMCNVVLVVKKGTKLTRFNKDDVYFTVVKEQSPGYISMSDSNKEPKK